MWPGRVDTSGSRARPTTGGSDDSTRRARRACGTERVAPNRSPTATPREVVSKILYLRQHYHFGPGKIADYLRRFHQQSLAVSSVHRILLRHGMNRLPTSQKHRAHARRWQRYEKLQPGFWLQLDVKFLERIPERTSASTSSRPSMTARASGPEGLRRCNQGTAIRFIDDVLRRLPFRVLVVQTDNGASSSHGFTGTWTPWTSGTLHPTSDPALERQGRTVTSDR